MRLQRPQLPQPPDGNRFNADLVFKVRQIIQQVIDQVNNLTEGRVSAVTNATTQPPTTGTAQQSDFIRNSQAAVLGAAGAQYVITGWTCVVAGTPGVWVENRSLTGT